jgi:hypothetical protein
MYTFSSAIKLRERIVRFITNKPNIYVCEWGAWDNYLFPMLFRSAIRIEADIGQKNEYILEQVTRRNSYFLFHINLSEISRFFEDKEKLCADLKSRNIKFLNKDVTDISKRFVQDTCLLLGLNSTRVFQDGDPDELLLIKSNDNYGGINENNLTGPQKIKLGITSTNSNQLVEYIVTERRNIEQNIWSDSSRVIERYISNTNHLFYRVYKINNRIAISEASKTTQIKKMSDGIKRTNYYFDTLTEDSFDEVRADMKELSFIINKFCTHFNLDFGALDVARNDNNQFYIIDVNTTPYWGVKSHPELELIKFLAGAL